MATQSFYEDLILDTPEAIAAMEEAFRRAERGECRIPMEKVRICTDPEVIDSLFRDPE